MRRFSIKPFISILTSSALCGSVAASAQVLQHRPAAEACCATRREPLPRPRFRRYFLGHQLAGGGYAPIPDEGRRSDRGPADASDLFGWEAGRLRRTRRCEARSWPCSRTTKTRWNGRVRGDFTPFDTAEVRFDELMLPVGTGPHRRRDCRQGRAGAAAFRSGSHAAGIH